MDIPKSQLSENLVVDFKSWLQNEYLRRRQKNANYSIRAFANYLGLASATVSQLLSGKRKPSVKFATKLMGRIETKLSDRDIVITSLEKNKASDPELTRRQKYQLIALDSFKLIADWHHYAILELISVRDFKSSYAWIAQRLGISPTEARQAIERLVRLDLIVFEKGNFKKTNNFVTNGDDVMTNSAMKQLQRHVLQKALDAIDHVPLDEKDISSMTMAIDPKKLPEAKKRITKFRRELCAFLEDGEQTRVFNLGIQLYPISK